MPRGARRRGLSEFSAGLIAVVAITVFAIWAFARLNPLSNPYELTAVFSSAQNLQSESPVRIAGVEVGKVTSVEPIEDASGAAKVHMEIRDAGLPIHSDARAQVTPRLFLEGNFVVEIKPGSPSAPEIEDGGTIPLNQTAHSVSFEQVLKVLDRDSRSSLQTLLDEYSRGLADGGAKGFRDSIRYWVPAYRDTALANDALLGSEEGDLRRVVRGQQRTLGALARDPEALKDLISNLNTTTAAFAREDDALEASIPALRDVLRVGSPALASLNAALPPTRAFAREALPGVRSADPALAAAQPFIEQLRGLVSERELKGVARDLRATVPSLVRLNEATVSFLEQGRALSSCTAEVLVPFATTPVPDPDHGQPARPFYKESQHAFVGLSGESRTGDANGQWFRLGAGSGPTTVVQPGGPNSSTLFAPATFPQLGTRPAKPASRPKFRPDVPCETQEPPDLNAVQGAPDPTVQPQSGSTKQRAERRERLERELRKLVKEDAGR
jgi:virulence factor Mce-like protein